MTNQIEITEYPLAENRIRVVSFEGRLYLSIDNRYSTSSINIDKQQVELLKEYLEAFINTEK